MGGLLRRSRRRGRSEAMAMQIKRPEELCFVLRLRADYAREHWLRTWTCLKSVEAFERGCTAPEWVYLTIVALHHQTGVPIKPSLPSCLFYLTSGQYVNNGKIACGGYSVPWQQPRVHVRPRLQHKSHEVSNNEIGQLYLVLAI